MSRAWTFRAAIVASAVGVVTFSLDAGDRFPLRRSKSNLIEVARNLDRMEQDLHQEGTIVIKAPDIWGESRLTKHRQEFERVMEDEIEGFELLLNASIRRSDQAYFANALAIQAALQGSTDSNDAADPSEASDAGNMALVNSLTTGTISGEGDVPITRTDIRQLEAGSGFKVRGFGGDDDESPAIGLEPTIRLDQLKRYLDHLHEIRRVNEGDDTSDSPGYSLNLVRVPVSILPGDQTKEGWGAEIEVTCKPHVTPELLARVFRELVINDLVDALSIPILKIAEDGIDPCAFTEHECGKSRSRKEAWFNLPEDERVKFLVSDGTYIPKGLSEPLNLESIDQGITDPPPTPNPNPETPGAFRLRELPFLRSVNHQNAAGTAAHGLSSDYVQARQDLRNIVTRAAAQGAAVFSPAASRNARQPVAPSQVNDAFGRKELIILAYEFWKRRPSNGESGLTDTRSFLKEQLHAGYEFLDSQKGCHHWQNVSDVHEAIRSENVNNIDDLRQTVWANSPYTTVDSNDRKFVVEAPSPVAACAWWILVESALLNHQLNVDMERVSQDPNCGCMWAGPHVFYGTNLQPDAQQAFIEYVNCRWPIHVFALDPVVQQQNIADQYSMRREMQLALALAFASGEIGAQSMTRYARRLEMDMETIALNQTQVAFGHGADTFGWRFTPRVQTPPFESTHRVLFNELIMGGPNRDMMRKRWELEPGQRECVAIVLMPSFIEHVTFHARGNYFRLKSPDQIAGSLEHTADWSARLRETQFQLTQCYGETERYLPGEIDRMRERVEQLAKQLPLQTVHARVPNENTIGGFEMFSSGVTDLGPELLDFYGHPGVDTNEDTTLFLVGNHFSVHDTHVIAGNRDCEFKLVSREVMKVTIPAGVQPVVKPVDRDTGCNGMIVDVHIATPYGVSAHLDIPVINDLSDVETSLNWSRREIVAHYRFKYTATAAANARYEIADPSILVDEPQELAVKIPPYGMPPWSELEMVMTTEAGQASILLSFPQPSGVGPTESSLKSLGSFDAESKQIIIRGAKYGDFHRRLRHAVREYLNSYYPNGMPATPLDITVRGAFVPPAGNAAPPVPVVGEFHVLIRLESI